MRKLSSETSFASISSTVVRVSPWPSCRGSVPSRRSAAVVQKLAAAATSWYASPPRQTCSRRRRQGARLASLPGVVFPPLDEKDEDEEVEEAEEQEVDEEPATPAFPLFDALLARAKRAHEISLQARHAALQAVSGGVEQAAELSVALTQLFYDEFGAVHDACAGLRAAAPRDAGAQLLLLRLLTTMRQMEQDLVEDEVVMQLLERSAISARAGEHGSLQAMRWLAQHARQQGMHAAPGGGSAGYSVVLSRHDQLERLRKLRREEAVLVRQAQAQLLTSQPGATCPEVDVSWGELCTDVTLQRLHRAQHPTPLPAAPPAGHSVAQQQPCAATPGAEAVRLPMAAWVGGSETAWATEPLLLPPELLAAPAVRLDLPACLYLLECHPDRRVRRQVYDLAVAPKGEAFLSALGSLAHLRHRIARAQGWPLPSMLAQEHTWLGNSTAALAFLTDVLRVLRPAASALADCLRDLSTTPTTTPPQADLLSSPSPSPAGSPQPPQQASPAAWPTATCLPGPARIPDPLPGAGSSETQQEPHTARQKQLPPEDWAWLTFQLVQRRLSWGMADGAGTTSSAGGASGDGCSVRAGPPLQQAQQLEQGEMGARPPPDQTAGEQRQWRRRRVFQQPGPRELLLGVSALLHETMGVWIQPSGCCKHVIPTAQIIDASPSGSGSATAAAAGLPLTGQGEEQEEQEEQEDDEDDVLAAQCTELIHRSLHVLATHGGLCPDTRELLGSQASPDADPAHDLAPPQLAQGETVPPVASDATGDFAAMATGADGGISMYHVWHEDHGALGTLLVQTGTSDGTQYVSRDGFLPVSGSPMCSSSWDHSPGPVVLLGLEPSRVADPWRGTAWALAALLHELGHALHMVLGWHQPHWQQQAPLGQRREAEQRPGPGVEPTAPGEAGGSAARGMHRLLGSSAAAVQLPLELQELPSTLLELVATQPDAVLRVLRVAAAATAREAPCDGADAFIAAVAGLAEEEEEEEEQEEWLWQCACAVAAHARAALNNPLELQQQALLCALDCLLLSEPQVGGMMERAVQAHLARLWDQLCRAWLPDALEPQLSPQALVVAFRTLQLGGHSYSYLLARAMAASVWQAHGLVPSSVNEAGGSACDPCDPAAWRRVRNVVYARQGEAALVQALPLSLRQLVDEWRSAAVPQQASWHEQATDGTRRMEVEERMQVLSSVLHFVLFPCPA